MFNNFSILIESRSFKTRGFKLTNFLLFEWSHCLSRLKRIQNMFTKVMVKLVTRFIILNIWAKALSILEPS